VSPDRKLDKQCRPNSSRNSPSFTPLISWPTWSATVWTVGCHDAQYSSPPGMDHRNQSMLNSNALSEPRHKLDGINSSAVTSQRLGKDQLQNITRFVSQENQTPQSMDVLSDQRAMGIVNSHLETMEYRTTWNWQRNITWTTLKRHSNRSWNHLWKHHW
jgi:hypothetical protein